MSLRATQYKMAAPARLVVLLAVTTVLIAGAASDLIKLKSNPDGNYAIGFPNGYINNGRYAILVPEGDVEAERQVMINGPGVRDSVYMTFNTFTMVFSDWDGLFMLGERVYTDKDGVLYFSNEDQCSKKVYQTRGDKVMVVDSDKLDKSECYLVRAKVEKALKHFLTTPFRYMLSHPSLKLQHTPGFPGGDYVTGITYGLVHCGQHTVELLPGDAEKERTIKVTAPGVTEGLSLKVDSRTKIFGSWNGYFYLGDKVFSIEPRTLVIEKPDGSCVKKVYEKQGPQIVVAEAKLLKQEDCFLMKSTAFEAFQKLIGPPRIESDSNIDRKVSSHSSGKVNIIDHPSSSSGTGAVQLLSDKSQPPQAQPSQPPQPPPIHVSSTVVVPPPSKPVSQVIPVVSSAGNDNVQGMMYTGNKIDSSAGQVVTLIPDNMKLVQQGNLGKEVYLSADSLQSPTGTIILQPNSIQQLNDASQLGQMVYLQSNDIDSSQQDVNVVGKNYPVLLQQGGNGINNEVYVSGSSLNDPSNTILLIPSQDRAAQAGQILSTQPSNDILNIQTNTIQPGGISLQSASSPLTLQSIDPNQQLRPAQGAVRFARSIGLIKKTDDSEVVNFQKNTVDLDHTGKVSNIQINDVSSKESPVVAAVPETPTVEVRVPASVTLTNFDNSIDSVIDRVEAKIDSLGHSSTNINHQDDVDSEEDDSVGFEDGNDDGNDSPTSEASGKVRFARSIPLSIIGKSPDSEVVNYQKNTVDLDHTGKVSNVQINDVSSKGNPVAVTVLEPPTIEVSGTVPVPLSNFDNSIDSVLDRVEAKIDSLDHSSTKINHQNNVHLEKDNSIVLEDPNDAPTSEASGKVRFARSVPLSIIGKSSDSEVVNYQKNTVQDHTGKVSNLQENYVAAKASPVVSVFDSVPKTMLHGLVRVGRSISGTYQDPKVLNSQVTNVDGSAINPNKQTTITSVQGNNILAPNGPNGVPIMPDMKATQVTTVTIPPNPSTGQGHSDSQGHQATQKLYINSNVILDQDTSRQNQARPVYTQVQSPQTNNLGSQTKYVRLASTTGTPMLLRLVPTLVSAAALKSQTSGTRNTPHAVSFVPTGNRIPATEILQPASEVVNMQTNKVGAQGQSVSNIQLNDLSQGGPGVLSNVLLRQPAIVKSSPSQVVPTATGVFTGTGGSTAFNGELKHKFSGTLSKSGDLNVALNLQSQGTTIDRSKQNTGKLNIPGKVPVSLLLNPDNLILNIAENTNFNKKKK